MKPGLAVRDAQVAMFESHRRYLLGLAYRILGSRAEAEDAVQDTFLKWRETDPAAIDTPRAWLTAACTRRAIDLLRSAHRKRVEYVGTWLPEPLHTPAEESPHDTLEMASSLSTAFLLLLERLSPKERAAYLLHEIFDTPYPEVAAALGMQEPACRKLVSRAQAALGEQRARYVTPRQRQHELLEAFGHAIASGATDRLQALLSAEIELCADSGGKVPAIHRPLHGRDEVLAFVSGPLRQYWSALHPMRVEMNAGLGLVVRDLNGALAASVTFGFDAQGSVTHIFIVRNPDKLKGLASLAQSAGIQPGSPV